MEHSSPGLAAYQRVVEAIKEKIRSGSLSPGDRLPGNRGLAEQYGVALGTAQKALLVLQDEGWLTATPSVGVFVSEKQPSADDDADVAKALAELKAEVAELARRVEALERRP